MIEYRNGDLNIISDFEIRPLMVDDTDIDLFIPIDYRTLNVHLEGMPNYIDDRLQLLKVRSIIIRFSTKENNSLCTVHFLRSIDLQSAVMNFVFDCKNSNIRLVNEEYSVEMYIAK